MSKIRLSELVEFNPKRHLKKGNLAPFVEMAALSESGRDVAYIYEREYKGGGAKFSNGDTLFARITPCLENGKTAKVTKLEDGVVGHGSTEFIVMSPNNPTVDEDYVYYVARMPDFRAYAQARMEGTSGRQRVSWQSLAEFELEIPDAASRKQAGRILKAFDDKIQLNNQINQTLEQMAQAIFKSWFVDFEPVKAKIAALEAGGSEDDALLAAMQAIAGSALFATDTADSDTQTQLARLQTEHPEQYATLRATAELFPSAMQESELGEIPEGWEVLPLSKMMEFIGGGTPKRSEPAYWDGDICWFSVKDAPSDGNVFVIDTVEKITDAGLKGSSTKLLPLGTTIITARGTVGKLALTGVVTAMNQSCYGVIGAEGTGPYLNYLQMHKAVETLQRNTHGAVFDTITQITFGTVFQAQACISLRANFETLVAPAFEMIKNNLQQIKALSELRDSLLPKLLSGELSLVVAEEQLTDTVEPAHV